MDLVPSAVGSGLLFDFPEFPSSIGHIWEYSAHSEAPVTILANDLQKRHTTYLTPRILRSSGCYMGNLDFHEHDQWAH